MQKNNPFLLLFAMLFMVATSFAQVITNKQALTDSYRLNASKEKNDLKKLFDLTRSKGWKLVIKTRSGMATLVGIDQFGYPLYVSTDNTLIAAGTSGTSQLWSGGSLGLNLMGASSNMSGKIAIWDGGKINISHTELRNRVIQRDEPTYFADHSTHVAGIMINSGINPLARGMAYGCPQLLAYDYSMHISEMSAEASNLLVSNHSYTSVAGWNYDNGSKRWEFFGRASENEDYKFGYYSDESRQWDNLAYNAPYYLIIKAAGNNRSQKGPAIGEPYFRADASGNMVNAGARPAGISSNDGYDIIPTYGTAKNILTVGAILPLSPGAVSPDDVFLADFSSWGPTDDGRIKPDVVADGVNILSSTARSDNSYQSLSGTSMASPVITGSLFLLQEYYAQLNGGSFMRSATLKGLVIHSAQEAGTDPGPDYRFGWGVANIQRAAEIIRSANSSDLIVENTLINGGSLSLPLIASGKGPLTATLCWTDPQGNVEQTDVLNNHSPRLVNDLDLRIKKDNTEYFPWILNPMVPSAAASKGDNRLDNVEKLEITDAIPGMEYLLKVSHKGTLGNNVQAYSLIISGAGGTKYCLPALSTGARILNVSIGSLNNSTSGSCSTYRLFESSNARLSGNIPIPFNISLGDCSTPSQKIVKIFIDLNQDGDFNDGDELLAASDPVTTAFAGIITLPGNLNPGYATMLRIIVKETGIANDVSACDQSGAGEVQDYKVSFSTPLIDISVPGLISPEAGNCPGLQQLTIRLRNNGTADQKNIPVSSVVKNGSNTIALLTSVYKGTIQAGKEVEFTYPARFNAVAGNNYTITSVVSMPGDQNTFNDLQACTVNIGNKGSAPAGLTARICGGKVRLKGIDAGGGQLFWYETPTSDKVIATGYETITELTTTDKKYYAAINEVGLKAGLEDHSVSTSGVYDDISNNRILFSTSVPLTIEALRLYTGNSGKVKLTIGKVVDATHYIVIASSTIDVFATDPTPQPGMQPGLEPADQGAVFNVNLPVPEAGDYYLIIQCLEGATVFYNTGIAGNIYPVKNSDVLAITGNSALSPGNPDFSKQVYLAIYDLRIKLYGCSSDRVMVEAENCDVEQDPDISIKPNPSTGSFQLRLDIEASADLHVSVYNMAAQKVFSARYPAFSGSFIKDINAGRLPAGVYVLRIDQHGNRYTRKLIIQNK